jgi:hypothetical protein
MRLLSCRKIYEFAMRAVIGTYVMLHSAYLLINIDCGL